MGFSPAVKEFLNNAPGSRSPVPMSEILGVTIEELLGQPKPRRAVAPGGKLGQVFREVSELPRRRQQRIVEVVEDMLTAQKAKA